MAFLGMDIGGTKRVLVVSDHTGRALAQQRRPMERSSDWRADLDRVIADARALVTEALAGRDETLQGVGVSVPGPVDAAAGILKNPPNLPAWRNAAFGPVLRAAFGVEIRIENDANAAALAESRFGAGRGASDLIYLTMSTGVGAGVIAGGALFRGGYGSAGEAGHIPVEYPGTPCRCGLRGCLEAYVGGEAWAARLREVVPETSLVLELAGGDRDRIRPEQLVAAMQRDDAFALAEFDRWLAYLARGIVPLVMAFDPERIVLGTIATAAGEARCFVPLREKVRAALWPQQAERLTIVPSELGDELPQRAALAVALSGTRLSDSA